MKRRLATFAIAGALVLGSAAPISAAAAETDCKSASAGGPMWIDTICTDPVYGQPVIDARSDVTAPALSHLVEGHFEGTNVTFRVFLPPAADWEGRFYQFTYPTDGQEPVDSVLFGATHGGYTVQTSGVAGYRHIAAAAKYARTVAAEYYGVGADSISGYLYGWSGGSYQVVGAMENSDGVWQGGVPIVQGIETSTLNNFTIRALAAFVLEDRKVEIEAALRPGGSGDPYAALSDVQRGVLHEATRMGIPLRAWEDFDELATTVAFDGVGSLVGVFDPSYVEDFWTKPGYLGTEQSSLGELFRAALAEDPGSRSRLARLAYHRYTLPTRSGFVGYDQYRDADGHPIYPQRATSVSSFLGRAISGGALFNGQITGKMIAVNSVLDSDAFPWHGAWYADQVHSALGASADDSYRIWYTDSANHGPYARNNADDARLVPYMQVVFQALDDMAAWTEDGIAPPQSTNYKVTDESQVVLPDAAAVRRGVQPTADLTLRGGADRVVVAAGEAVHFSAKLQVPPGAGQIVSVEWDFEGDGTYEKAVIPAGKSTIVLKASHTYGQSGSYYPVVRVGSQRDGDATDTLTIIQNLDRANVVVN